MLSVLITLQNNLLLQLFYISDDLMVNDEFSDKAFCLYYVLSKNLKKERKLRQNSCHQNKMKWKLVITPLSSSKNATSVDTFAIGSNNYINIKACSMKTNLKNYLLNISHH